MNPARFVLPGGATLLGVGAAGLLGLPGRRSGASFFHAPQWFDLPTEDPILAALRCVAKDRLA